MHQSSWVDPAVIVQAVAVLVASVAAGAVIWQAILTRRALSNANESLDLAEKSLKVAREAQAHAALLSVEAVKARVAVNAPSADLVARRDSLQLLAPSTVSSGYPQPWPANHVFHISDASQSVMVRISASLRNTGPRATRFTLWRGLRQPVVKPVPDAVVEMVGTEPGPWDVLLEPGESIRGYWEVTRTLAEWISVYDERASGSAGPEYELTAYVDDGFDNGASYRFTLALGGTVIEPASTGLRETWKLVAPDRTDAMDIGRRPVTAKYWISKSQELPLRDGPVDIVLSD